MSNTLLVRSLIATFVLLVVSSIHAQECAPPVITANTRNYNIFSPEQEMVLGDLNYQRMSGELRFINDHALQAYITALGQKLVKHLPPTGLRFQFYIVDMPEANAFNTPGGFVFVSRKLIGFVNNEDELAGVMAHELGHATVRHAASDFSAYLKQILNVTQVGDRKDITDKYNLLIERSRTKTISRSSDHESSQQLEADKIGLFAMVAAGYDPNAFTAFFDRLVETKGKTGNWFSDIFGKVRPEQKRLREMIKVTDQLPAQCRENRQASASGEFLKWQASVVSYREGSHAEQLSGLLWKKNLNPGLRSDISHFAFSPDGNYLLAQDDFAITVLKREPLAVELQIPAPEALPASFTPDNKFVTFGTEALRYEKWSINEKRPIEVRELVVRRDCWEHQFSPDGRFLACVDFGLNLNVLDTQTGKKVFEKKEIYQLDFLEFFAWVSALGREGADQDPTGFFFIIYSPDSRYLAVSRTSRYRFRVRWDAMTVAESENTVMALDLTTMKPINVGGDLKKVTRRAFVFLDSTRVIGMASEKVGDSGVFSFPEGKRQSRFEFAGQQVISTSDPNYVVIKPISNAKLGVFDVSRGGILTGMNKVDATVWHNYILFESTSGNLVLAKFHFNADKKGIETEDTKTIEIPAAAIGNLSVAEVSDNFQWLAMSSKTRGAVWDLASGDRKLFVRGFRGAVMSNDGGSLGDFPKFDTTNHSVALLNPKDGSVSVVRELAEHGARQYGRFVLVRESLKPAKESDKEKKDKTGQPPQPEETETNDRSLNSDVRMSLRDIIKDNVVWTREFKGQAPRFFFDKFSGRLIFYWTLGSAAGKNRLKEDPALAARPEKMGNTVDDYLLEIVDAFATKTIGTALLETGKGSFTITAAYSEGRWLILHDSENRILAFNLQDGEIQQRFFGSTAAINPTRNQIAVENYSGEVSIYDLATGDKLARLILGSDVAFIRFSIDGKRLFVLTDEQVAYAFDIEKLVVKQETTASVH
jgi:hypothetical protein